MGDDRAFVTLLTEDGFLPGVQALVHSLRATDPPTVVACVVVLVTPSVSRVARAKLKRLAVSFIPVRALEIRYCYRTIDSPSCMSIAADTVGKGVSASKFEPCCR